MKKQNKQILDPLQEEDKNFFYRFLEKKTRNFNKKLKEIENLEDLRKTKELTKDQLDKVSKKEEYRQKIQQFDEIAQLYHQAQQEGKQENDEPQRQEVTSQTPSEQPQVIIQEREKIVEREVHVYKNNLEVLKNILHFTHVAEFFKDSQNRQPQYDIPSQDFQIIYDLFQKIFSFPLSAKFEIIEKKLQDSLIELDRYLQKSPLPAMNNRKYQEIFLVVESIASTRCFLQSKGDVFTQDGTVVPIGSEVVRGTRTIETPVKEPEANVSVQVQQALQHETPQKQQPRKPSPQIQQQSAQKQPQKDQSYNKNDTLNNPISSSDEEDERTYENEPQQQDQPRQVQENKVDEDGFITVQKPGKKENQKKNSDKPYRRGDCNIYHFYNLKENKRKYLDRGDYKPRGGGDRGEYKPRGDRQDRQVGDNGDRQDRGDRQDNRYERGGEGQNYDNNEGRRRNDDAHRPRNYNNDNNRRFNDRSGGDDRRQNDRRGGDDNDRRGGDDRRQNDRNGGDDRRQNYYRRRGNDDNYQRKQRGGGEGRYVRKDQVDDEKQYW